MACLQLTWDGFEAAVDIIAAMVDHPQNLSGVYGGTDIGRFLAVAVAYRLGMSTLEVPSPGMLLVDGAVDNDEVLKVLAGYEESQAWVWVDATGESLYNSVMKVGPGMQVSYPWEDALSCRELFIGGLHD